VRLTKASNLNRGLVGAWCPSVAGNGLLLPDLSGYGNHGTLTNMDASDWVGTERGRAVDFDITDDLINCGPNVLNLINGRLGFSVSAWVSRRSFGGGDFGRLFEFGNTNNNVIVSFSSANVNLNATGGGITVVVNSTVATSAIAHYACSVEVGVSANVYVDSTNVTASANLSSGTIDIAASNLILGNRLNAQRALDGQIADFRVYNRALSPSEIKQLYEGGPGFGLRQERKRTRSQVQGFNAGRYRRQQLIGSGVY
jgi:hypothetical protein